MSKPLFSRASLAAFLAAVLVLTALAPGLARGAAAPDVPTADVPSEPAVFDKTEVVYANLSAEGVPEGIYVVNRFDVAEAGLVADWGAYEERASLTGQALRPASGGQGAPECVEVACEAGVFSYQGTAPAGAVLPWDVEVSYRLNGQKMTPDQIAGKSGDAEVRLSVTRDASADAAFAESFMVQATFTLDGDVWTDVDAEGAVVAMAGSDKTVAFTLLPGRDGEFAFTGHVEGFTLDGAQLAALPYATVVEMPDASDLEGQMGQLADAIAVLDGGSASLASGADALASGGTGLKEGTRALSQGLDALAASSGSLTGASAQIAAALDAVSAGLAGADLSSVEQLGQLAPALRSLADGLDALGAQSAAVRDGYDRALAALDGAAADIPAASLSQEQIGALVAATQGSDNAATVAALLEAYEAAQRVGGTYQAVRPALDGARQLLAVFAADGAAQGSPAFFATSLRSVASGLEQADPAAQAGRLSELAAGIGQLADQYRAFDEGLGSYVAGVGQTAQGARALVGGAEQLAAGIGQLASGAGSLADGTGQLAGETADLPARMRASMDDLMADYDFPAFEPASFVDERNESVTAVQFVMALAPVEPAAEPDPEPVDEPGPTVLDRLLALFA